MPMTINTNVVSLNAQRNLTTSQGSLATSMQRLSSGLRVNSAKDDAAGLAIADRMNAQIRGINVAIRNANDGISLAQTAEGALATVTDALQRMRELAVQAQNGSNGTDRPRQPGHGIPGSCRRKSPASPRRPSFNGMAIVGASAGAQMFQVGANNGDTLTITTDHGHDRRRRPDDRCRRLDRGRRARHRARHDHARSRATYGAAMSRFGMAISNLSITGENQSAARGRIMDADFAVGDGQPVAGADPAAGRQRDGGASQPAAEHGAHAPALIDRDASRRRRCVLQAALRGGLFRSAAANWPQEALHFRAIACRERHGEQAIGAQPSLPGVRHAPDDQHQHLVAERAAAPEHVAVVAGDLDGAAVLGPARQLLEGRRRRPGDRRPHERADPRHQRRDPQRQRRHLAGADRRRRAGHRDRRAAAHARAGGAGAERLATAPATAPTSTPNTSSSRPKSPGSRPRPSSTAPPSSAPAPARRPSRSAPTTATR